MVECDVQDARRTRPAVLFLFNDALLVVKPKRSKGRERGNSLLGVRCAHGPLLCHCETAPLRYLQRIYAHDAHPLHSQRPAARCVPAACAAARAAPYTASTAGSSWSSTRAAAALTRSWATSSRWCASRATSWCAVGWRACIIAVTLCTFVSARNAHRLLFNMRARAHQEMTIVCNLVAEKVEFLEDAAKQVAAVRAANAEKVRMGVDHTGTCTRKLNATRHTRSLA